jgi:hypothetical protein
MNNPDHISESLETIFWDKYLNSLMWIRDPEWKKFGSGKKHPDPQHWKQRQYKGTPTKRQVSKRQVSKRQVFKMSGFKTSGFKTSSFKFDIQYLLN